MDDVGEWLGFLVTVMGVASVAVVILFRRYVLQRCVWCNERCWFWLSECPHCGRKQRI